MPWLLYNHNISVDSESAVGALKQVVTSVDELQWDVRKSPESEKLYWSRLNDIRVSLLHIVSVMEQYDADMDVIQHIGERWKKE